MNSDCKGEKEANWDQRRRNQAKKKHNLKAKILMAHDDQPSSSQ